MAVVVRAVAGDPDLEPVCARLRPFFRVQAAHPLQPPEWALNPLCGAYPDLALLRLLGTEGEEVHLGVVGSGVYRPGRGAVDEAWLGRAALVTPSGDPLQAARAASQSVPRPCRPAAMVFSDSYTAEAPGHVFPFRKYAAVREGLRREGWEEERFLEPRPASRQDLERVHDPEYLDDLENLRETWRTLPSELPVTASQRDFACWMAGGTLLACREALERGCAVHLGGGFHHAFAGSAEGFCYLNDAAVAIRCLQAEGRVERVLVVDLDLHQGNGTARIFQGDDSVFTFSMHQEHNYPVKEWGDLDIGLPDGTGDAAYLGVLMRVLPALLDRLRPHLVIYLAGADPYRDDQLGGLALTMAGLRERDEAVLSECCRRVIPVAVLLAGGYARDFRDTREIHMHTCRAVRALFG